MEKNNLSDHLAKFAKWSKICLVSTMILTPFSIAALLLIVLKGFTDLETKVPFLFSATFAWIAIAVFAAFFAFVIFCFVKVCKYKTLAEKSENDGNEDTIEQSDSDE